MYDEYMSQCVLFLYKVWLQGALQKMGERCGRVQFDLSKKLAENFLQKNEKNQNTC